VSSLPRTPRLLLSALGLAALALSGMTCGGDRTLGPSQQVITSLARVGGDGQTGTAGQPLPVPLVVKVLDAAGAPISGVSVSWTIRSGGGSINAAGGATDGSGLNTAIWTLGPVAGADTISVRLPGAATIAPVVFAATAVAGPPVALVIRTQPTATTAGAAIAPPVQVTVEDALGNVVTAAPTSVTMAITSGTGTAGANLGGTRTRAAVDGVASFNDLSIDKAGTGYTLTASATGPTSATSASFSVAAGEASPATSVVTVSRATVPSGDTALVTLRVRDAMGNALATGGLTVAFAAGAGTSTGTFGSTTDLGNGAYTAVFTGLAAGTATTIGATIGGSAVTTALPTVTVVAAGVSAAQTTVTAAPGTVTASTGSTASTITVTARDAHGNPVTGAAVTLTAAGGGNTLVQPAGTTDASGVATGAFSSTAAGTHTVTATIAGVVATQQPVVTVTAAAPAALTFFVQPSIVTAGAALTPAVVVDVRDAFGNIATGATNSVTIAIGANPGGATLGGTLTRSAVAGVAAFADLSLDRSGSGYTLLATSGTLSAATSAAFAVTAGSAASLAFTSEPAGTTAGAAFGVAVTARDPLGNPAVGFTGSVTLSITSGTGRAGAHLSGTLAVTAVAGVATFSGLGIDSAGTGYTLTATAAPLTSAVSTPFNIGAGTVSAEQSSVVAAPTSIAADGSTATITVTARDSHSNPISGATVALAATGTGNTVTQPVGTTNASGVATGTLSSTVAEAKTVSATIDTVGITQTASVTVTPGVATHLVFTTEPPASSDAGAGFATVATARDAAGNTATGFAGTVNVAITGGTGTAGAHLLGTTSLAASAGVATFSGLSIDSAGTGYTLTATATGPSSATSGGFTITPGAASTSRSVVTVSSGTVVSDSAVVLTLQARDQFGNTITTGGQTVVFSASGGTSTGTFGAVTDHGDGTYTATFTGVLAGTATTIGTSIGGSAVTSTLPTVAVTPNFATRLVFHVQPSNAAANATVAPDVVVHAVDNAGNLDPNYAFGVALIITSGTGTDGAALTGGMATAVAGVATFPGLSIDLAGMGYRLDAFYIAPAPYRLSSATSDTFNIF
jgi:hypothetical protein